MGAESLATGAQIVARCRELGFALAGIAPAAATSYREAFETWLAEGRHGSMGWLAEHVDVRADPCRFLPGACSLIMVADQYASRGDVDDEARPGWGRVARYARGRDYHREMKRRLHVLCDEIRAAHPGAECRAFVDTAPVLEREHASRGGLGWIGKHTLLINSRLGSYLLLGGVATTLELHAPEEQPKPVDHCGTCTRCIDACPTDAIAPYALDASRCVAYLTIERREPIEAPFHDKLEGWLFGCDICQEVCPHNSPGATPTPVNPAHETQRSGFDLLEVLGWDASDRSEAFRGSALKRARLDMIKRNALLLAACSADPAMRGAARDVAAALRKDADAPLLLRETARQIEAAGGEGSELNR